MIDYDFHELSNIFPLIAGAEFEALKVDIAANGIREPIILHEGKVLDGRNRLRAARAAGIEPAVIRYQGADPLAYVISLNLHRRHLSESQRAMVAANIVTMKQGSNQHSPIGETSQAKAAELLNVGKRSVERAAQVRAEGTPALNARVLDGSLSVSAGVDIASLAAPKQDEIVARGRGKILQKAKEIRVQKAIVRRQESSQKNNEIAGGNLELTTDKKYPVVYCDPPWQDDYSNSENRVIENHYPTMTLEAMCALPVGDISHNDAVLFMWATSSKLCDSMKVLEAWGFTYHSCAVWDKGKNGMGYYFRQQHELLLIGARGALPAPEPAKRPDSILRFDCGDHSAKPHEVAELIATMYPRHSRIELFGRGDTPAGWDAWGDRANAEQESVYTHEDEREYFEI